MGSPSGVPASAAVLGVVRVQGADAQNVELIGHIGGATYAVAVQGNYAYVGEGPRLTVLDVSDPVSPTVVGKTDPLPGVVYDVAVAGSYAYVADGYYGGLRVMDISDPAHPTEVGYYNTPGDARGVAVAGNYAYVADYEAGLRVVDVSDSAHPTEVGSYDTPGAAHGVAVAGNYAYVADYEAGLRVVDVSDPVHPTEVGAYDTPGWAWSVAVSGGYAYVADGWEGIRVVDISNPARPIEVGNYNASGYILGGGVPWDARDVVVVGDYAYVAFGGMGLRVVDVSDPAHPVEVGFHSMPEWAYGVAAAGGYAYVADGDGGLFILRPDIFEVSGYVTDVNGDPSVGVWVRADSKQTTTDATGAYAMTNLPPGTYTVTPTLAGYIFCPPTRTVTLPPDATGQNFTILPAPVSAGVPSSGGSLILTDTQGLTTTLAFPAGAVTQTTTVVLTPTLATGGAGFTFAGHAFELAAFRGGNLLPGFSFEAPVTVTIHYSDRDVRVVSDESRLALMWWTGSGWEDAAQTCTPPSEYVRDLGNNVLSVAVCHLSEFALLGPTHQVYLPLAVRRE